MKKTVARYNNNTGTAGTKGDKKKDHNKQGWGKKNINNNGGIRIPWKALYNFLIFWSFHFYSVIVFMWFP